MDSFAFIIHPVNLKQDVQRKFPLLGKLLPEPAIHFFSQYFPPVYISEITGIISQATGKEVKGWFIACPLSPLQMVTMPPEKVYKKVIAAGKLAQKLGAQVLGLGGFTAVVGDGGQTVAKHLAIPVTTGDSYTVATAVEGTLKAAQQMGISPEAATAAVVGATGSIGRVCAQLLARQVERMILVGRDRRALEQIKLLVEVQGQPNVQLSTDMRALQQADMVLTVTNAIETVIEPGHLKSGSVVCDVARPRDVSRQVVEQRDDVLVIEGGMVKVPGPVNFNFNFGFPSGMAFACMAETITLALEGRKESFTLGKNISLTQVQTMAEMASRHGFSVSGFRSFERAITDESITEIKERVHRKQARLNWANP
ncbi:MAG TPA: shikimate dehydrogenase [Anaerolineae bacterium]|nr:shikimate dehydrogenase [Anaerolineae bacterium]HMR62559.1 shikimate dehydrogenase [Anaerolineae bacterium]